MKKTEQRFLEVEGQQIPVDVHREARRTVRASVGKKAFILRMPLRISSAEEQKHWQWFVNWATKHLSTNQAVRQRFFRKSYKHGDVLQVGKRKYQLAISYENRKTHGAKLEGQTIRLNLSQHDREPHLQKSIRTLLSRIVAQDFQAEITERVLALNKRYFNKSIQSVNLKYNHSNWGSCSSRTNVNLSTRLLFAPDVVIDYVIIHELAHLVEMNHSPRFWKVVEKAMPNYEEQEKWLKEFGGACDF